VLTHFLLYVYPVWLAVTAALALGFGVACARSLIAQARSIAAPRGPPPLGGSS
jgi:hypothetical protein